MRVPSAASLRPAASRRAATHRLPVAAGAWLIAGGAGGRPDHPNGGNEHSRHDTTFERMIDCSGLEGYNIDFQEPQHSIGTLRVFRHVLRCYSPNLIDLDQGRPG